MSSLALTKSDYDIWIVSNSLHNMPNASQEINELSILRKVESVKNNHELKGSCVNYN